ncbi:phosphatases II [Meira miltonrushii]|uniref:Phosphatases II n=1 Tax=Meira miltonrushii TaxID=1280837 RepID=A0A316V6G3_9BASI|nr:phosphatases II [Meira miltonrushii]PWN32071.1 phosphatases II [Meira miltonrushii]
MSFRQSISSKFHQFITPNKLSKMVTIPPARCDLALANLDEIESERLLNAATNNKEEKSAECSYTTNTSLQNRKENRWTDILAYDHSLLPGDYLNASLIPPFPSNQQEGKRKTSFIASQAPLPHTLNTFYEKIIQSKTKLVVNLTPFRERGRTKADEYWPLQQEQVFNTATGSDESIGQYSIRQTSESTLLDEKLQATLYSLEIKSQNGYNPPYELAVLHVTSWADFGNYPEDVFDRLLNIINEQHGKLSATSPIWVHCSAGVGRSGTVIAALMARESDVKDLQLSISSLTTPAQVMEASIEGATKLIDHERRYRPRMVQTGEQFEMVAVVIAKQLSANQHAG